MVGARAEDHAGRGRRREEVGRAGREDGRITVGGVDLDGDHRARRNGHAPDLDVLDGTADQARQHPALAERHGTQQLLDRRRGRLLAPGEARPGGPPVGEQADEDVAQGRHGGLVSGHHQTHDQGHQLPLVDPQGVTRRHQPADQVVTGVLAPLDDQSGGEGTELPHGHADLLRGVGSAGQGVVGPVPDPLPVHVVQAHETGDDRDGQRAGEPLDDVRRPGLPGELVEECLHHRGHPGAPAGDRPGREGPLDRAAQPLVAGAVLVEEAVRGVQQVRHHEQRRGVPGHQGPPVEAGVHEHPPCLGVPGHEPDRGTGGEGAQAGRSGLGEDDVVHGAKGPGGAVCAHPGLQVRRWEGVSRRPFTLVRRPCLRQRSQSANGTVCRGLWWEFEQ